MFHFNISINLNNVYQQEKLSIDVQSLLTRPSLPQVFLKLGILQTISLFDFCKFNSYSIGYFMQFQTFKLLVILLHLYKWNTQIYKPVKKACHNLSSKLFLVAKKKNLSSKHHPTSTKISTFSVILHDYTTMLDSKVIYTFFLFSQDNLAQSVINA